MAVVDRAQVARCVSEDQRSRCYSGRRALLALLTRRVTFDLLLLMSRIPFLASETAR